MTDGRARPTPHPLITELDARARRVETPCGEGRMVWRIWGEGEPILLNHGASGAWSHWIRNIDALVASGRSVIAPDLPGFGDSAPLPSEDSETQEAVLAEGLRIVAGDSLPMDMVAFSYGGGVTGMLVARRPELARRLVLVDTGGLGTPLGPIAVGPISGLRGAERVEAHRANLLGMMLHAPESVDALALSVQEENTARGRFRQAGTLVYPDKLRKVLPEISCRVDAIWGEHDRPYPPAVMQAAIKMLKPDAHFHLIPGAGHWAMFERADAFNALLLRLLAEDMGQAIP